MPTAYLVDAQSLTDIADAIRSKGSTSASLSFPTGFINAIGNISGETVNWNELAAPIRSEKYIHDSVYIGTQEAFQQAMALDTLPMVPDTVSYSSSVSFPTSTFTYQISTASTAITVGAKSRKVITGTTVGKNTMLPVTAAFSVNSVSVSVFLNSSRSYIVYLYNGSTANATITPVNASSKRTLTYKYASITMVSSIVPGYNPYSPFPDCVWFRDLDDSTMWFSGSGIGTSSSFYGWSNISSTINAVYWSEASTIFNECFKSFANLENIYNVENVQLISNSAFDACSNLKTVNFPACTSIGSYAFQSCSSLTNISFPVCTTIGGSAFRNCQSLTSAIFPSCTSIGNKAFAVCKGLSVISFPMCNYLGGSAFTNCIALEEVNFSLISNILTEAFYDCTSLRSVSFPSCQTIGSSAFYMCSALTEVSFPNVIYISERAFLYCRSLTTAYFPKCYSIHSSAFRYCYLLSNTNFESCTHIYENAFEGCSALSTISLPLCSYIYQSAFLNCTSLISVYLMGSYRASITNSSVFQGTPMETTGTFYVPSSMVSEYQSALGWSYFSSRIVGI